MFCSCSADYFGKESNTHTCPVCLGLPGALPVPNKAALENCMKLGLALGCKISDESRFERKNYFYPDLPKGYQISQYRWPLCKSGIVKVRNKIGEVREIRINRVHQEEDTGKLTHSGENTLIDYNRSGVPLVEIVTEPDFRDTEEIRDYAKKIQQICRYLGISNADMEKGDMRLEANVSVRKVTAGHPELVEGSLAHAGPTSVGDSSSTTRNDMLPPYRVELKNINSFRFMVAAVEYEIRRQIEALDKGERLIQETRGWNENKKQTYTQRVKEEANDYRYFADPDLTEMIVDSDSVKKTKEEMQELPVDKQKRFVASYGLSETQAIMLTDTREFADYFEEAVRVGKEYSLQPTKVANTLINKKFNRDEILPAKFVEMLVGEQEKGVLPDEELEKIIAQAITDNPQAVADYKKGKESSVQFLVGQVMKFTHGKADPNRAKELLTEKLSSRV